LSERRLVGRPKAVRLRKHPFFEEHPMLDLILLALGLGFFALSIAYTYACDRL
jgi:hypothetical protein